MHNIQLNIEKKSHNRASRASETADIERETSREFNHS